MKEKQQLTEEKEQVVLDLYKQTQTVTSIMEHLVDTKFKTYSAQGIRGYRELLWTSSIVRSITYQ